MDLNKVVSILKKSKHTTVFTGAGISVESGIPPFRGKSGLWSKYDPIILDINYFYSNPKDSWKVIKEIFYDFFGEAKPNIAHKILAELENMSIINSIITQNIDNLHQEAGSKTVYEFHGTSKNLICTKCNKKYNVNNIELSKLPPLCKECNSLLKPDFIFFGEGIPKFAYDNSMKEAAIADVFIIIGTTGEIMPASMIPQIAKQNNATIIEINPNKSNFTTTITDIFLQGKASEIMKKIKSKF